MPKTVTLYLTTSPYSYENTLTSARRRKPEDITLKASDILRSKGIEFAHEAANQIDAGSSKVITSKGKELSYDFLVISTGRTCPSMKSRASGRTKDIRPAPSRSTMQ